ncbi:MAG: hypothetical protein IT383_00990 [Deltaproteobacteria bacterium]|nr:hypothetical protein [Deltaproteobacteria bacterium]
MRSGCLAMLSIVFAAACGTPPGPSEGEGDGPGGEEGEGEATITDRGVCESDSDCDEGALCSNYTAGDFRQHCTIPCSDDASCEVGDGYRYQCLPTSDGERQTCARVCDGPGQCGDHGPCVEDDRVDDGLCVHPPGDLCTGDATCATDEACVYLFGDYDWTGVCGPRASVGGKRTGDACDATVTQSSLPVAQQCATGFCDPHGVCSGPCGSNQDCPGDTFSCQGFATPTRQGSDVVGWCLIGTNEGEPCERDADCQSGEVCAFTAHADGYVQNVCRAPLPEEGAAGEPCAPACQSAMCVGGSCSRACLDDVDCDAGFECERISHATGGESGACVPE